MKRLFCNNNTILLKKKKNVQNRIRIFEVRRGDGGADASPRRAHALIIDN